MAVLQEALRLAGLGYITTGVGIAWENGEKKFNFKTGWQKSPLPTPEGHPSIRMSDNGLLIVTGEASDVFVIDLDKPKQADIDEEVADGIELFQRLVQQHGLPATVPHQQSGSGGHHYFFSLSKSVAAGLTNTKGQTKLTFASTKATIDTRINNNGILVNPTSYDTPTGTRHYSWANPLCSTTVLPPAPAWLIAELNNNTTLQVTKTKRKAVVLQQPLFQQCQPLLIKLGFNQPEMTRQKANGFDFVADRACPCPCCLVNTHTSQEWYGMRLCDGCFEVKSYSSRCRPRLLGFETQRQLLNLVQTPACDAVYCDIFASHFKIGASVKPIVWTGLRWLQFHNHLWRPIITEDLSNLLSTMTTDLMEQLARLQRSVETEAELARDLTSRDMARERFKALLKGIAYIKRGANQKNMIYCLKSQMFHDVGEHPSGITTPTADKLDGDPYLFGCENGIVDLQCCKLRDGRPEDWVSRSTGYAYAPDQQQMDTAAAFFRTIYPVDDEHDTMQKWFGYNLLGHASEKRICFMTDLRDGDNGKSSVLKAMAAMMGQYAKAGKNAFLYKSAIDNQNANSHDAGLLAFRGFRATYFEELDGRKTLDSNLIKSLTNGVGAMLAGRGCGAADEQQFQWTAKITVCFNQHELPDFKYGDAAFLKRPFSIDHRALFCRSAEAYEAHKDEPYTHMADESLLAAIPTWTSGILAWALAGLEEYHRSGLRDLPEGVRRFGKELLESRNTVAQWLDEHVEEDAEGHCDLTLLFEAYQADVTGRERATRAQFKKAALAHLQAKFVPGPAKKNGKIKRNFWEGLCQI